MPDHTSAPASLIALHACDLTPAQKQLAYLFQACPALQDQRLTDILTAWQAWHAQPRPDAQENQESVPSLLLLLKAQFMQAIPDKERPLQKIRSLIKANPTGPDSQAKTDALAALDACISIAETIDARLSASNYHDTVNAQLNRRPQPTPEKPYSHMSWMCMDHHDLARLQRQESQWRTQLASRKPDGTTNKLHAR